MTDGFDRGAIMARRALLISSALASFQCSNTPPATEGPVGSSEVDPRSSVTLPSASAVASLPPPGKTPPMPPWDDQIARGPSRALPDGLPESVKQPLSGVNALAAALEKDVRQLWEPKGDLCNPSLPECRAAWRELGDALLRARESTDRGSRSLCGGNVEAPAISKRREEHRAFFRELIKLAETHWGELAASFGPLAEQEWQKQVSRSNVSPPMPCLSCAAPRTFSISTIIGFGADSAALDAAAKEGVKSVATIQSNDKRDLELWGIAAPGEKDPNGIAKKRAEAVRDELVKNGYDKAQLSVIVIGTGLGEKSGQGRVEFLMKERPS